MRAKIAFFMLIGLFWGCASDNKEVVVKEPEFKTITAPSGREFLKFNCNSSTGEGCKVILEEKCAPKNVVLLTETGVNEYNTTKYTHTYYDQSSDSYAKSYDFKTYRDRNTVYFFKCE